MGTSFIVFGIDALRNIYYVSGSVTQCQEMIMEMIME